MGDVEASFKFPKFTPLLVDPVELAVLRERAAQQLATSVPGYPLDVNKDIAQLMEEKTGLFTGADIQRLGSNGFFNNDGHWHIDVETEDGIEGELALMTTSTSTTYASCDMLFKPKIDELLHRPLEENDFTNGVFNNRGRRRVLHELTKEFGVDWLEHATQKDRSHFSRELTSCVEVDNLEIMQAEPFMIGKGLTYEMLHRASKWSEGEPRTRTIFKGGARIVEAVGVSL